MDFRYSSFAIVFFALFVAAGCSQRGDHTHITNEATPPTIIAAFHRDFPGLTLSHVDRIDTYFDHATEYEVKFRDAAKNYHRRHYTADGKLIDSTKDVVFPATMQPIAPPGR